MDKREDSLPPDDEIVLDDRDPDRDIRESETELDEDDRLRPEFVSDVLALAEAGEHEAARERVGRLHPADIADLFELLSDEDRPLFASVLGDLLSPDVLAEMNEHVREQLIDLLARSEEHTSELQSPMRITYAVFCLKKKTT